MKILFTPGYQRNNGNCKKNKTDNNSSLNIRFVQISVEFFHTQFFLKLNNEGCGTKLWELNRGDSVANVDALNRFCKIMQK